MSDSIIKKQFVKKILTEEAKRLEKNQSLEMRKLLHFHTGTLDQSRSFTVQESSEMDGKLVIRHVAYQRFLDIKKKGKVVDQRIKKARRFPIHNRYVFGHYYSIANRLMVDFTNDVAAGIKKNMEK